MSVITANAPVFKSVQRFTITCLAANATATATISSVDTTKSWVNSLGFSVPETATFSTTLNTIGEYFPRVALTNATTVTLTRGNSPGNNPACPTISGEVVTWLQ